MKRLFALMMVLCCLVSAASAEAGGFMLVFAVGYNLAGGILILVDFGNKQELTYHKEDGNGNDTQQTLYHGALADDQMPCQSEQQHLDNSIHVVSAEHFKELDADYDIQGEFKEVGEVFRVGETVYIGEHIDAQPNYLKDNEDNDKQGGNQL